MSVIKKELDNCESFDFSIAFIANSGVQVLMEALIELEQKGIPGRILTTTYLDFNSPDALERVRRFSNIEFRVFEGDLHTKGYFFKNGAMRTLMVGSSNLTQSALMKNQEWNLLVRTYEEGSICHSTVEEFERLWNHPNTKVIDEVWLEEYRKIHQDSQYRATPKLRAVSSDEEEAESYDEIEYALTNVPSSASSRITPNRMQEEALANLKALREKGEKKALLISATGTGKTYLAALDVAAVRPKRVLFVIHRARIANDAKRSFERVMDKTRTCGIYSGSKHELDADYIFCTVQTLTRHLDQFEPDEFDYIIIDETHRAGAESYQRVLNYFKPGFLLGMTATPDRNDGYDIYKLYDNNIAYQITLQDAQEDEMLAPFHYFGITDLNVEGEEIGDSTSFSRLTSDERVKHIINQIENYSVTTERRGLVFCSKIEEAKVLSEMFCKRGYRCCALAGEDSDDAREKAIERLECNRTEDSDWLEYIFTVDIFNEGIDIPSLNQIIMLRPTKSAIVFVQQLGRGLRLHEGKEYVLVLDFIGNYQNSFLIPTALSGNRSGNKDNLRRYVKEGSRIVPGCSTINFDRIAEARIYKSLDAAKFGAIKVLKEEYGLLKNMLGRVPSLDEFDAYNSIDPLLIFNQSQLGSYHMFLSKYESDYETVFSRRQEQMLVFVSRKLAAGKRPHELMVLKTFLETDEHEISVEQYRKRLANCSTQLPESLDSVANVLSGGFLTGSSADSFSECDFVRYENGKLFLASKLKEAMQNAEFRRQMSEVIDFGLRRYQERYAENYKDTNFVLYEKYTYEDVCRLLNWDQNVNGQNIGGYKYDEKTNTYPVFINYEKNDDIAVTIKYEDRFVSQKELIALSKQPRYLDSPEIRRLKGSRESGMRTYLFVRKNKDDEESKEFYFLGEMNPTGEYEEVVMTGTDKHAVEIGYVLDTPVKDELYDYLTSNLESA